MIAILYAVAAIVAVLSLAVGGVYRGSRALHAWQHTRCLTRIAALEVELGLVRAPTVADRWKASVSALPSSYVDAILRGAAEAPAVWRGDKLTPIMDTPRTRAYKGRKPKAGETGMWFGGWDG